MKQNKLIRDEEYRLKDEQRNKRIQAYLQMKPQNFIEYSRKPTPIYKSSKLEQKNYLALSN